MLIHPYFSQNYASIICQGLLSCPHIICKVFCPHKPVLEVFSIISCAATADIVKRFKKRDVAPSVIGKDDSMTLLAHIFSRRMAQRDLTNFLETVMPVQWCPLQFYQTILFPHCTKELFVSGIRRRQPLF